MEIVAVRSITFCNSRTVPGHARPTEGLCSVEPHSYLRSRLYFFPGVSLIGSFWISLALFLRGAGNKPASLVDLC